jgi:hypothetical protein
MTGAALLTGLLTAEARGVALEQLKPRAGTQPRASLPRRAVEVLRER